MPASRDTEPFDGFVVTAEPVEEPDPVFYTDQTPKFEITFTNAENAKYRWGDDSKIRWNLILGRQQEVVYSEKVEPGPLERGEETTVTVETDVLAYEGHGVFAISSLGAIGSEPSRLDPNRGTGDPLYTFSVWDKSHYEASIQQPKHLQIGLVVTSIVLIIFAFIQVAIAVIG